MVDNSLALCAVIVRLCSGWASWVRVLTEEPSSSDPKWGSAKGACDTSEADVPATAKAAIIAAAKLTPATTIIAVDIQDSRLELAKELGATHTINSKGQDVVALVRAITNGDGTDGALDATGNVGVIESMIAATANNGTAATVGGAPRGRFVQIEAATWIGRNVSYVGSCQGSSLPQEVRVPLEFTWNC